MWSIFSRDPTSSFNYDILDYCPGLEERSLWRLHNGKKKGTGDECSIFAFDMKNASDTQAQVAKSSFKRMKTLRHPNLVTYIDGLESDKVLYVVTEPVIPLLTYLNEHEDEGSRNEFGISWGLHQVIKGLTFLIKDCHLIHNNVCLTSIFVNRAGEWLLGGLEYIYPSQGEQSIAPIKIMPLLEKYDPPEKATQRLSAKTEWSTDMWGLGCLIWEVFNGLLNRVADLKTLGKLPKTLTGGYATLVSANPKSRPNPQTFVADCRRKGGFMCNKFVDAMIFLEEIQIKDQAQKTEFLESLNTEIENFPAAFCRHKILPQLIKAFEFGDAGANILMPLLKVGKFLESDEYQKQIVPCVVKMFNITDRQTRVKLLQQMGSYIEHIPIPTVNDQLFPSISMGFNDTNPLVRETTIKAMLHMASKLNYKNLNEELMKHFARLQSKDDQGGIRTNTTVCLGKIACFLNPQIRQKVLPSAYTRALRDPFPPARQATLLAMQASVQYFPIQDVASRLLPSICPLTRDPEKGVRDKAFIVIDSFVSRLKSVSDDPELLVQMEKDLTSSSSTVSESQSWTGWAMTAGVSSLSSLSSITSKFKGRPAGSAPGSTGTSAQSAPQSSDTNSKPNTPTPTDLSSNQKSVEDSAGSGWGDDDEWEDIESKPAQKSSANTAWEDNSGSNNDWGSGWNDENADSAWNADAVSEDEFEPIEPSGNVSAASSYNWDSHNKTAAASATQEDFFSSIATQDKKPSKLKASRLNSTNKKPSIKPKASSKANSISSSGWGDDDWGSPSTEDFGGAEATDGVNDWGTTDNWGGDDWTSSQPAKTSSGIADLERKKREREEKRLERQRALAEKKAASNKPAGSGRAMKLGAKKIAKD